MAVCFFPLFALQDKAMQRQTSTNHRYAPRQDTGRSQGNGCRTSNSETNIPTANFDQILFIVTTVSHIATYFAQIRYILIAVEISKFLVTKGTNLLGGNPNTASWLLTMKEVVIHYTPCGCHMVRGFTVHMHW
jgi:hypothetical protein